MEIKGEYRIAASREKVFAALNDQAFAKGGAVVALTEDGSDTILKYEVDAQVGGKIAQVGARLITGTAKKLADQFFGKFAESVGAPPPVAAA